MNTKKIYTEGICGCEHDTWAEAEACRAAQDALVAAARHAARTYARHSAARDADPEGAGDVAGEQHSPRIYRRLYDRRDDRD